MKSFLLLLDLMVATDAARLFSVTTESLSMDLLLGGEMESWGDVFCEEFSFPSTSFDGAELFKFILTEQSVAFG